MRPTGGMRAAVGALAVLAGLFFVALATASEQTHDISERGTPYRETRPTAGDSPSTAPSQDSGSMLGIPEPTGSPPEWIGPLVQLVARAVVAALAGLVIWYVVRGLRGLDWSRSREIRRDGEEVESSPADVRRALTETVDEVLVQLDEGETRDAIIACWLRLEEVAASAGAGRRPAETAGELTERVLALHQVDARTLTRLADLYREARFSAHTLGEPARVEARSAWEAVRGDLTAVGTPLGTT